jgi:NAD+ diphosphatase
MFVFHHRHAANVYASGGIERAHLLRSDAEALRQLLARPDARVVPVWRSRNLVVEDGKTPLPGFLTVEQFQQLFAEVALDPEGSAILLGFAEDKPYFAIDLSLLAEPEIQARIAGLQAGGPPRFADLRDVGPLIGHQPGAILAYARGLTFWHERHKFCGVCGSPTQATEAGHVRRCTNEACKAQHFPRTDPAVIMLVTDGDRVLLGRQKIWPPGQHSILAGFVEPGESLEDAVAREVEEEVGLKVRDIRYQSSQPWPFPASIMLGFTCVADSVEPKVNTDELESARWFTREEIRNCPENDTFRLPRRVSISRRLIEDWKAG